MTQRLRALAALPEVLSSIPSNHMVVGNHLRWELMPSSGASEDVLIYIIYIYIKYIHTYIHTYIHLFFKKAKVQISQNLCNSSLKRQRQGNPQNRLTSETKHIGKL